MPRSRASSRTTLVRVALLALLGWVLYALRRSTPEAKPEEACAAKEMVSSA